MVEMLCLLLDKDKVSLTKTPKLDRSDGGKEVKERATKRKLPFTVGTNGDQKDSDTGNRTEASLGRVVLQGEIGPAGWPS
uniref:Ankyrin repeat domain-containing protein 11 n=1 Tax=Sphaerodactylus townsendi TaxID=933632 RepID=A0ACB8EB84_9SAUR